MALSLGFSSSWECLNKVYARRVSEKGNIRDRNDIRLCSRLCQKEPDLLVFPSGFM